MEAIREWYVDFFHYFIFVFCKELMLNGPFCRLPVAEQSYADSGCGETIRYGKFTFQLILSHFLYADL